MRNSLHRSLCTLSLALLACRSDPPSAPADAPSPIDAPSSIDAPSDRLDLALIAGDIGGPGNLDGTGAAARLYTPTGVAVDGAGNVYVTDYFNHTLRKITAAGVVTTLAGSPGVPGSTDGAGAAARFNHPAGVAVDSAGNIYVADYASHTIRKITPTGDVTTLAGAPGGSGSADGATAAARFNYPFDVAIDSTGNMYVADVSNHTIRKITPAGVVTTLAGTPGVSGISDGTGAAARFHIPVGVAVDSAGNLYVTDSNNSTIRKVTPAGVVTTLAGTPDVSGSTDGPGATASFGFVYGVAVDGAGNVYVAEQNGTIRKVTAAGFVTTLAGVSGMCGYADGTGTAARFCEPRAIDIDGAGNLYIPDTYNHVLRKMTPAGVVTTMAGAVGQGSADGTGPAARFGFGVGVALDSTGTIYVTDRANHTLRKVTAAGVVTTLAGTSGVTGSADGTGAAARFSSPSSMAIDSAGNLYVADWGNSTIRKITTAGVVTTLAGTPGSPGSADGVGPAARFTYPLCVAVDRSDNVYVSCANHTIRKITPGGVVTTLAGTAGAMGSTDGTGAAARFNRPSCPTTDPAGNVYVSDNGNHTIRKITPAGVVSTLAGAPGVPGSTDGTGAAARFYSPTGLVVDIAGNLYVSDTSNSTIRKITAEGTVTTVVGTAGKAGIILGTSPGLSFPSTLALAGDSIIFNDTSAILVLRNGAR